VELFGQLACDGIKKQTLEVPESCTAGEAAVKLNLDTGLVGLVTIDGVQADHECQAHSRLPSMLFSTHVRRVTLNRLDP